MGALIVLRQPRGKRLTLDGRERFRLYPNYRAGGFFMVAIGYQDGRVKISCARSPRHLCIHQWVAADGRISWSHCFAPLAHGEARRALRRSLAIAASFASRIRETSYFRNLKRDQALACVRAAMHGEA